MVAMVKAVVFDWFGTLASWAHGAPTNYVDVLDRHGYVVDPAILEDYVIRWDGVDHSEHSTDRETYLAWTRARLLGLASELGIAEESRAGLVDEFLSSDREPEMATFPETIAVLEAVRDEGYAVAVCSNWGWDLEPVLEEVGIHHLIDVPITSAQAGFRKPHPGIYTTTLGRLGIDPTDAIFVGDSWAPDVLGPVAFGMTAVHIARDPEREAPNLPDGSYRIQSLSELLTLPPFSEVD
jgi:putative hydrolase of the HAD superfamily